MSELVNEVRQMHIFLGISERPITIYRKEDDRNCPPPYEQWLEIYAKQLRRECEEKLVSEYNQNLGKNLFKQKFSSFQEFQLQ